MLEDGLNTQTTVEQTALEQRLIRFYQEVAEQPPSFRADCLHLLRDAHAKYLYGGLGQLPAGYAALDAGRPWICYWILHSLALLKAPLQTRTFLLRMCVPPAQGGGFTVCEGGEVDVRGCYTALAVAYMLQLDVARLVNASGMVEYVRRCQTYEGGLGGEPGNEAHGGYTYCGLAALVLAGRVDVLDLPRLLHWCVWRQGNLEGGFMGRTNKAVRPAQQAQNNVAQCKAKADALIKEAVAAEAQAAGASAGDRARLHAAAVQVVGQAADAQQAVERALDHVEVVAVSAPALLPEQSCRHNKDNLLERTDPLINIVDHKLAAAREFFLQH
ncbi:hypothetical protein WJX72_004003 [[Myrmecia] bisecta]|uniref:Prenyltransferase alpha-alpha toroid domain-containing protein n=1 Tax=[Myrmecia] bisecta TaxID=41462 RepID=A0AAW1PPV5_9CHLO